jgi:hypothetical protein
MIEAYPLSWPAGYPRSPQQRESKFKITLGAARDYVKDEIRRIAGTDAIISTNVPLKGDGDLRADWNRYRIEDTGVAVYFTRKKQQVCLCCDTYSKVWENLYAVGRTIAALRQIDRDGVSDFLDRTFSGFKALPEQSSFNQKSVWEILGLSAKPAEVNIVHSAYRNKAKVLHPDAPTGSAVAFQELQEAYQQILKQYQ